EESLAESETVLSGPDHAVTRDVPEPRAQPSRAGQEPRRELGMPGRESLELAGHLEEQLAELAVLERDGAQEILAVAVEVVHRSRSAPPTACDPEQKTDQLRERVALRAASASRRRRRPELHPRKAGDLSSRTGPSHAPRDSWKGRPVGIGSSHGDAPLQERS